MSDDLISRSALLEDFRKTITESSDTLDWLNMINRQPIAYDVDKVINKLNVFPKLVVNQYPLHGEYLKKDAVINIVKANTEKNCLNCRVTKEDLSQEICNKCVDYSKWI